MTNQINGEHKTPETNDDTYGKRPMTIQGWRQSYFIGQQPSDVFRWIPDYGM